MSKMWSAMWICVNHDNDGGGGGGGDADDYDGGCFGDGHWTSVTRGNQQESRGGISGSSGSSGSNTIFAIKQQSL
jgi:hypothetical protein